MGVMITENAVLNDQSVLNVQQDGNVFIWQAFDKTNRTVQNGTSATLEQAKAEAQNAVQCTGAEWIRTN
jgi:hypothetical protein